ncbi:low molecular weight protein arginine phosphatase [Gemmatimonadota bacterium]
MPRPDSPSVPKAPLRLLFVCSGNTCRSPLAEVLARGLSRTRGLEALDVRSAGTSTVHGLPASEGALRAADRHALDLQSHQSTPLTPELVAWADLILTMEGTHLQRVQELGGGGKAALLGVFAQGVEGGGRELSVPDPFGGDDRIYEEVFHTLEGYVDGALQRLSGEGGD